MRIPLIILPLLIFSFGYSASAKKSPTWGKKTPMTRSIAGRTPGTMIVEWSPSPGAAGYRVYYGTEPGVYFQKRGEGIDVPATESPKIILTGLISGKTYYITVSFYNSGGESGFADEIQGVAP